ncbi:hypothetical protein GF373_14085 [bacterium]|nr:hypothetical protein [bacterium]
MTKLSHTFTLLAIAFFFLLPMQAQQDFSPKPSEEQLPQAMHSAMDEQPSITVGQNKGDILGTDNRALQAAVDYIANLGGGTVIIGPGTYTMHDSLHLRSHVTVKGTPEKTILAKADGAVSLLALDGDFGEEQVTLQNPEGFSLGGGMAIWDDSAGGFHTTVACITGRRDHTFKISKPLMADCMVHRNAKAATVFPVVSGYHIEGAKITHVIVEGNKKNNIHLNGCRGAGIFLYRGFGAAIEHCTVKNYNGDGISFQQSNDVTVTHCVSENNASLGIHPGSGSQRPTVTHCMTRNNGTDGLFLCWRVRHGVFKNNQMENNGRFGISIGHKDSDNILKNNIIRGNDSNGIFFRNETRGMAPHRNRLENNIIENNGKEAGTAGVRIRGEVNGLMFTNNIIRDTRAEGEKTQTVGFLIEEKAGEVHLNNNKIEANTKIKRK